jgi:hypothetical protein
MCNFDIYTYNLGFLYIAHPEKFEIKKIDEKDRNE